MKIEYTSLELSLDHLVACLDQCGNEVSLILSEQMVQHRRRQTSFQVHLQQPADPRASETGVVLNDHAVHPHIASHRGAVVLGAPRVVNAPLDDRVLVHFREILHHLAHHDSVSVLHVVRHDQIVSEVRQVVFFVLLKHFKVAESVVPLNSDFDVGNGFEHDVLGDVVQFSYALQGNAGPTLSTDLSEDLDVV